MSFIINALAIVNEKILSLISKLYFIAVIAILSACGAGDEVKQIQLAGFVLTPSDPSLSVSETGSSTSFTIKLESQPTASVNIELTSGDITEGLISPSSLLFDDNNWDNEQTVTVTGVDDNNADGNQTFQILFSSIVSEDPRYANIAPAALSVLNSDNDTAGFTVTPNNLSVNEIDGNTTATYEIFLNTHPESNVSVKVSTSDKTELLIVGDDENEVEQLSVNFSVDDWSTPKNITLVGINDDEDDGNQTVLITHTDVASTDESYNSLHVDDLSVVVVDNNIAAITIKSIDKPLTSENGRQAKFSIVLNSKPLNDVILDIASSNLNEGDVDSHLLTFTAENYFTPQVLTVTGQDDVNNDGMQTYTIKIKSENSTDDTYKNLEDVLIEFENIDDEQGIVIIPPKNLTTSELGTEKQIAVILTQEPTSNVQIKLASDNPAEGLLVGGDSPNNPTDSVTLTFSPEDWRTDQFVRIVGQNDDKDDGNQEYSIVINPAVSDDVIFNHKSFENIRITNIDDDTAGITLSFDEHLTTSENGDIDAVSVHLNSLPNSTVELRIQSDDISEGLISGGNSPVTSAESLFMTFTPNDWKTSQDVSIKGQNDAEIDGDVVYNIIVSIANTDDSNYVALLEQVIPVTNVDNDKPKLLLDNQMGLVTSEDGDTASFTVALSQEPAGEVKLNFTSGNAQEGLLLTSLSDGPAPSVSIEFNKENWRRFQAVTIVGQNDNIQDGNQVFNVEVSTQKTRSIEGLDTLESILITNIDNTSLPCVGQYSAPKLVSESELPTTGSVCANEGGFSLYRITNLKANWFYTITLDSDVNEITIDDDVRVGSNCSIDMKNTQSNYSCYVLANNLGEVDVQVRSSGISSQFTLSIIEDTSVALEGSIAQPLVLDASSEIFSYEGKANNQLSYYQVTGLQANKEYYIKIDKQSLSTKIWLYKDNNFTNLQCEFRKSPFGIISPFSSISLCIAKSDVDGNVWLGISAENFDEEVDFSITTALFDASITGSPSEPVMINVPQSNNTLTGSVSISQPSFYLLSGLKRDTFYQFSLAIDPDIEVDYFDLSLNLYTSKNEKIDTRCRQTRSIRKPCLFKSNGNGEILTSLTLEHPVNRELAVNFDLTPYSGFKSEGRLTQPLSLTASNDTLNHTGSVSISSSYYKITDLQPNHFYGIKLNNLTSPVLIYAYSNPFSYYPRCGIVTSLRKENECLALSDKNGTIWLTIDGSYSDIGSEYSLEIKSHSGILSEGRLGKPHNLLYTQDGIIHSGTSYIESSYYKISGLYPNSYYDVSILGDDIFGRYNVSNSVPHFGSRCSGFFHRNSTESTCKILTSETGNIWINILGLGDEKGITFDISLKASTGILSQGKKSHPYTLEFTHNELTHTGSVNQNGSYYKITGLVSNAPYKIGTLATEEYINLRVYSDESYSNLECSINLSNYEESDCTAISSINGDLWIETLMYNTDEGSTFDFHVQQIDGIIAEGGFNSPVELIFRDDELRHFGGANSRGSYYKIKGLVPLTNYQIRLNKLINRANLFVFTSSMLDVKACSATDGSSTDRICIATSDSNGNLWINVEPGRGTDEVEYEIVITSYSGLLSEGTLDESLEIVYEADSNPYVGSTNVNNSYYKISALQPDILYAVTLTNMTEALGLSVDSSPEFHFSTKCRWHRIVQNGRCLVASSNQGNLWVIVDGKSTNAGASFDMQIEPYDGVVSEGTRSLPIKLEFSDYGFLHDGMVGPNSNGESYYEVSHLFPNTQFIINVSELSENVILTTYDSSQFSTSNCSFSNSQLIDKNCITLSNDEGTLWLQLSTFSYTDGSTFRLSIKPYDGLNSEGSRSDPKELMFSEPQLNYTGSFSALKSYYKVSGMLAENSYILSVSNIDDLRGIRLFDAVTNRSEKCLGTLLENNVATCVFSSNSNGEMSFSANTDYDTEGRTFDLTLTEYDGPLSEGTANNPVDITYSDAEYIHNGSVLGGKSYYRVTGLESNSHYSIKLENNDDSVFFRVYANNSYTQYECYASTNASNQKSCIVISDENGFIWISAYIADVIDGELFDIKISPYLGNISEGNKENPLVLSVENDHLSHDGTSSERDSYYKITGLNRSHFYSIYVKNASNDLVLKVTDSSFNNSHQFCNQHVFNRDIHYCLAQADEFGNIWINVNLIESELGETYDLVIEPYAGFVSEGNIEKPFDLTYQLQFTHGGTVSSLGSFYKITGLSTNTQYIIGLSSLGNELGLSTHSSDKFKSNRCFTTVSRKDATKCSAMSDENGNLWIRVTQLNSVDGSSFQLTVVAYEGAESIGTRDEPALLEFQDPEMQISTSVSPSGSYYNLNGLNQDQFYVIKVHNISSSLRFRGYQTNQFATNQCIIINLNQFEKHCILQPDELGNIWIKVTTTQNESGATFDLAVKAYAGLFSEGSEQNPLSLQANEGKLVHQGKAGPKPSYYNVSNLMANSEYVIQLSDDSDAVTLSTTPDQAGSIRDCRWNKYTYLNSICLVVSDESGNIDLMVRNSSQIDGASYELNVSPYEGVVSEGTEDNPVVLTVTNSHLQHRATANPTGSFYQLEGLSPDSIYLIQYENTEEDVKFHVTNGNSSPYQICHTTLIDNKNQCTAYTNENATLSIVVMPENQAKGITLDFELNSYTGLESEGTVTSPKELVFEDGGINFTGSVNVKGSFYKVTNLVENTDYVVRLSNASQNLTIKVFRNNFSDGYTCNEARPFNVDIHCLLSPNENGNFWIEIRDKTAISGATFDIDINSYTGELSEGQKNAPMELAYVDPELSHNGSSSPNDSYYQINGLTSNTHYLIKLTNMSNLTNIRIKQTEPEYYKYCNVLSNIANENNCLAMSNAVGELTVMIDVSFDLRNEKFGANYDLTIVPYSGILSEGSANIPYDLAYEEPEFGFSGKVNPLGSFYKVSGLQNNQNYTVSLTNLDTDVDLEVYSSHQFSFSSDCGSRNNGNEDENCLVSADENGNLWIKVKTRHALLGTTFELGITQQ